MADPASVITVTIIYLSVMFSVFMRFRMILPVRALSVTRNLVDRKIAVGFAVTMAFTAAVGCSGGTLFTIVPTESAVIREKEPVEVFFFWSGACATCGFSETSRSESIQAQRSEQARLILEDLSAEYPQLEIMSFEVTYHPENRERLESIARSFGVESPLVPMVFVGSRYWTVFGEDTRQEIEACVKACLDSADLRDDVLTRREWRLIAR